MGSATIQTINYVLYRNILDYMAAVSTTTVVGWVVSPILRKMLSLVQSYVSSQYNWKSNMVSDLKNLEATLMEVLLVVDEAERRHSKDRNQVELLCRMREAVCDAEDVLDKFDYKLIREKIEHQSMARSIVASSLSLGKRLVGLDKLRAELHMVVKSMARVRSCAEMFARVMAVESTNSIKPPGCVQNRATGSFPCEGTIFGRKEEVDELVGWLLNRRNINSSDEGSFTIELHSIRSKKNIELHSIVGVGGIGKTTVAQSIYNDKRIVDTFDTRMWVSVSHNFDKINLIKEIIAHASGGRNIELTYFNFSMLQEELQRRISNKKFLLVLDDVWYDENCGEHINIERWRELIAPMENALAGSKILVTTRMELVAKMLDCSRSFFLQGLGQDDSWLLFRYCHSYVISSSTLQSIGMQIVQKLNGSPLALKVIGRHLYGRQKVAEWNEVLHSDILNSDDMLTILRSSYEGLPVHLQRCFSYCSLFPKGYHIDPEKLVYMWIAQDLVDTKGSTNNSLKEFGRSYFDELLARSFFQMLTRGNETFYVMHDMMSDLALHVSQGECLRVECESMEEMPLYTQHLSIYSENLENLVNHDLSKLRSLIVLSKSWFCSKICLNHAILGKLKSVRVLDITGCCLEQLPDAVNRLIHLRYLGIRRTFHPLPRKMLMYHLQALFVQYHSCYSPREYGSSSMQNAKTVGGHFHLPESIHKLVNLVHVDVERAYVLMLSSTLKLPFVECAGEFHVNEEGSVMNDV